MFIVDFFNSLEQSTLPLDEQSLSKIRQLMPNENTSSYFLMGSLRENRLLIDSCIKALPPHLKSEVEPIYNALVSYGASSCGPNRRASVFKKYVADGNLIGVAVGVELGVNIDTRVNYKTDFLQSAFVKGAFELLSLKLPSAWFQPSYDCTPLALAALFGHFAVVRYLVEKGADFNAKTKHGYTVLDLASKRYYVDIENYLTRCGAIRNLTSAWETNVFRIRFSM